MSDQILNNLEKLAAAKCDQPMNTWPSHEEYHRGNFHPFAGSRWGERYFDELCLRCQLEKYAMERQLAESKK